MSGFKSFYFRYIKSGLYILIAISLMVCLVVFSINVIIGNVDNYSENTPGADLPTEAPKNNTNKVKLQFAGDILLNNTLLSSSSDAYGSYNFDTCFSELSPYLDGDVVMFNLEGVLDAYGNGTEIGGAPIYNYPKEIAASAKKAGFNLCVTANDRAAYFGTAGIKSTITSLCEVGLSWVGTSVENSNNYVFQNFNGINIAILAYTDKPAKSSSLDLSRISVVDLSDIDEAMKTINVDIAKVKALGAEIIIASMHWGEEMAAEPTSSQRELADRMIKSGVDVIAGTLSNVFQPITYKSVVTDDGESKNAIVAYCLGNVLAHPTVTTGQKSQESAILNVFVERDSTGKAYVSSAECLPIFIYAKQKSTNAAYSYSVLPCSKYVLNDEMPEIFTDEADWNNCKTAYNNIKNIIEKSGASGLMLGLV